MASARRHKSFTDEEIVKKRNESTPQSTLKCDKKWTKVFREYLMEKDCQNTEFWTYPEDELDSVLAKFWFEVRSNQRDQNGDFIPYSLTSLRGLRNALTRELVKHNRNIDLTSDPKFKKSQTAFKDASKELKRIGKGVIHSYPEIEHAGACVKFSLKLLSIHLILSQYIINFNLPPLNM